MPLSYTRTLNTVGDKGRSRSLIVPKKWWDNPTYPVNKVNMTVDKAMILSPEQMDDDETIECILFILKQRFEKDNVIDIFRRVFDIEIIEQ